MNENDNEISKLLSAAFSACDKLFSNNKKYAPIYNSYKMLKKIEKYYKEDVREISKEAIDEINVGLLAAKALDFDIKFSDYAQRLHDVWHSFLTFLGNSIPSLSGSKKKAYDFYIKQGFTQNQAKSHLQGIDFSKKVDDNFRLNKGNIVAQWKLRNIVQGNYYSKTNNTPSCLGIYHEQENYQGNRSMRIEHQFCLRQRVICLKSYAAAVTDTWSIKNKRHKTQGGCIQYFNAKDANYFQQIYP